MKVCYREIKFRRDSLVLINKINQIISEYQDMGYSLTLRQVYYQLVARDIIPNTERSYKNIGNLISDGRIAGLIDWEAIEDRTRNMQKNSHWSSPGDIINSAALSFAFDKWADQEHYVEVWVEKEALVGIVGQMASELDVPYFSCRGYVSQSEMWAASQRLRSMERRGQRVVIIHLGDHDPSGRDMSRDIFDRLDFFSAPPIFRRIALNMDQIEQYNPPPNPTKITDSRADGYIAEFGYESWELDALSPAVMASLIRSNVEEFCDLNLFRAAKRREDEAKQVLENVSANWDQIMRDYL